MKNFIKKQLFTNKPTEALLMLLSTINPIFIKLYPSNKHYKKNTKRKIKNKGINFVLDISDYQEYLVYFNLENDSSRPLLKYIPRKRGIILDIGANIGQTSLWIADSLKQENVKIIGFEPYPTTFEKFKKNLELNKYKNIQIENIALGSKDDKLIMFKEYESNSGGYRAIGNASLNGCSTTEVSQVRLDSFLENQTEKITFIKIDVEGFEYSVLQGAVKTILKDKPILYIELSDANLKTQESSAQNLVKYIRNDLNYNTIINMENMKPIQDKIIEGCSIDILCKP